MAITKVTYGSFNKYQVRTGAGNFNLPAADVDALYGPGWPITPVTRPEDSDLPRVVDYPVGINYTLQPRVGYENLMPITALKAAYANVSEVSAPVNLLIRELCGFVPILRDKKTLQKVSSGHPYEWMTTSPDRKTPFNVWMTRFKKSSKVYAAPAYYKRRDGGKIIGMEYIDGSTFFLIVNDRGELPDPDEIDPGLNDFLNTASKQERSDISNILNSISAADLSRMIGKGKAPRAAQDLESRFVKFSLNDFMKKARDRSRRGLDLPTTTPAFTQIIKGVPFSFWDKSQIYFVPEPPAPATDSPYGESYIERAFTWIQVIAVLTAFQLGHYRTGNMPEGWATLPKDMFPTLGKIAAYERVYNDRMSESSQVAHSRIRFGPDGMKWIPTKKPEFPKDLYNQAKNNIMYAIGMPPSEMGEKPGSGLGGKGFAEGAETDVMRQILEAEKEALEDAFNAVLKDDGVDDVAFYLDYPQEQINPAKQAEDLWTKFEHGLLTLNDVLSAQNKEPIGSKDDKDNLANMHLIISGSNIFVLEKIKADENGIVSASGGAPRSGGSPMNPEDQAKQPIPGDKASREKIARQIELAGGKKASAKKIFLMGDIKKDDGIDPKAFAAGMMEEQEHIETVGGDLDIIAGLVRDHLAEDPNYYDDVIKTFEDHAGRPGLRGGSLPRGVAAGSLDDVVSKRINKAKKDEKNISPILKSVAEETGASFEGWEYRIKAEDSLKRKVEIESELEGISPLEMEKRITDVNRYTMIYEPDDLVDGSQKTFAALKEAGYQRYDNKVRNYFKSNGPYRGYNTVWENPETGSVFELQFHTPASYKIKSVNHLEYETVRVQFDAKLVSELDTKMKSRWSSPEFGYIEPKGVEVLESYQ